MDKLDFDILLTPIYSVNESQDVALVSGLASATQQIKNIVYLNYGDRPFNTGVGADLQSIFSSNLKFNMQIGVLNKYQNKTISTGSKIFINNLIVESFSYQVDSLGLLVYTMDCTFQMNDINNDGLNFTIIP
jgi:hypothetical protein